jgi:hypothetical protein
VERLRLSKKDLIGLTVQGQKIILQKAEFADDSQDGDTDCICKQPMCIDERDCEG